MNEIRIEHRDLKSIVRGGDVPTSVILPPEFDPEGESLPLLIYLHGAGGTRDELTDYLPMFLQQAIEEGALPPLVMVGFSSDPGGMYVGWEEFVVDELPQWMHKRYGTRLDREGTVLIGPSMGGLGTARIGLKNPGRFLAIAPLEPGIDPSLTYMHDSTKRNAWLNNAVEPLWGDPVDEAAWVADNPASIVCDNAEAIAASGLEIYLEVGDEDGFQLHDGTEYLHRLLWDHDIRHEYHLVRWADHDGLSIQSRFREGFCFLGAALTGERIERSDLPPTPEELAVLDWVESGMEGEMPPLSAKMGTSQSLSMQERALGPMREIAKDDPAMARNYAELPPTK